MSHSRRSAPRKSYAPPPAVEHLEDRWLLSDTAHPFGVPLAIAAQTYGSGPSGLPAVMAHLVGAAQVGSPLGEVVADGTLAPGRPVGFAQPDAALPYDRPIAPIEIGAQAYGPPSGPGELQSGSGFVHDLGGAPALFSHADFPGGSGIESSPQFVARDPWPLFRGPVDTLLVVTYFERAPAEQTMGAYATGNQTMAASASGEQTMAAPAAVSQTTAQSVPANQGFVFPAAGSQSITVASVSPRGPFLDRDAPAPVSGSVSTRDPEQNAQTTEGPAAALAPLTATLIGIPSSPLGIPSHGAMTAVVVPTGQDLIGIAGGARDRVEPTAADSKAIIALGRMRTSAGGRYVAVPHDTNRLKDTSEASASGSRLDRDASSPAADELSGAQPQQADLLTRFLPFDRASLENAIDELLDQFNDLGASLPDLSVPMRLVPASLAVALALLASEAALRLRSRSQTAELETDDEDGFPRFPGLPNNRTRSIP